MPVAAWAQSPMCLTDIKLTQGEQNWAYELQGPGTELLRVGSFEADRGGAWGTDQNQRFSENWVTISAQRAPMSSGRCITEITTYASPWPNHTSPRSGQQRVGSWDTDGGGSSASAGGGGDVMFTLAFSRMTPRSNPGNVITQLAFRVSNSNAAIVPSGYNWVGNWDVRDGVGGDGVRNEWMATLSWQSAAYAAPAEQKYTMTGRWERIGACQGQCSGINTSTTVGSDKSFRDAVINTQTKELSISVGTEVQTDSGKLLPGAAVTASLNITGTIGEEVSKELEQSLTTSGSSTIEVSCEGHSSAWIWVSSINFGGPSPVEIRDRDYVCAGATDAPGNANDFSWGLNFSADEWISRARDGQNFTLNAPSRVRYGDGARATVRDLPAGMHFCGPRTFNNVDPAFGTVKSCETPRQWQRCAREGQSCAFTGTRDLRFGPVGGPYVTLTGSAGPITCTSASFGRDPAPGKLKRCWTRNN